MQANNGRWYTYAVFDKQIVGPNDAPCWNRQHPVVTLITCHPYRGHQRMIVFGRLVSADVSARMWYTWARQHETSVRGDF